MEILTNPDALQGLGLSDKLVSTALRVGQILVAMDPSPKLPDSKECERLATMSREEFEAAMQEAGNWPAEPDWGTFAVMATIALRTISNPETLTAERLRWEENAYSIFAAVLNRSKR